MMANIHWGLIQLMNRRTFVYGIVVAAIAAAVLLGSLIPLAADDYCHGAGTLQNGIFGELQNRYVSWSGRYAQGILTSISFIVFRGHAVWVSPALLLIALIAALTFALQRHTRTPLLYATIMSVLYVGALDAFAWQAFYWMSGGQTYIPPIICAALLWGLIERQFGGLTIPLLAFFTSGFHEVSSVIIGTVLVAGLWKCYRTHVADALIGLSFGALVVILAPGNGVRDSMLAAPLPVTDALFNALAGSIANLIRMVTGAPFAVAAFVSLGASAFSMGQARPRLLLWALAIGIGFSILSLLPAAWRMGNISPPRFYALSTAIWCAALMVVGAGLPRLRWRHPLSAIALVGLVSIGRLYAVRLQSLNEPYAFERLASLDTPESAEWVRQCAVEWDSQAPV